MPTFKGFSSKTDMNKITEDKFKSEKVIVDETPEEIKPAKKVEVVKPSAKKK